MEKKDQEILFSRAIKAGTRIYYLDVKKNRKDEFFVAITESKKIIDNSEETPIVTFEKHKIFLYEEDINKFNEAFAEVTNYIKQASEKGDINPNVFYFPSVSQEKEDTF